jgi:adenosylmethionine-8-amino-7-oxononanoate aminotransferase
MFYTYSAHPLACAIADKVLEIMEREHLVERSAELGARLGAQLKEELSGHPMVGDIRGIGMFWGLELVRDRATRTPYNPGLRVTSRVLAAAIQHGLFVYPSIGMAGKAGGDGLMVTPPFVIEDADIGYIVRNLRTALDEVHAGLS